MQSMDVHSVEAHSCCSPHQELSCDELESHITELAAHIHAATYRLLVLIAEFDRREGWGGEGVRSMAHWLNWKCGIGMNAAREKVRVAHALEALPKIAECFSRGELSYSKVRAMTRVANPDNQDYLLMIARHGTAWHVEQLVRQYRRVKRLEESAEAERLHDERYLQYFYDEDGSLVIEARLPPDSGALLLKALEAAREQISTSNTAEDVSAETLCEDGEAGRCAIEEGPAIAAESARRLGCDASRVVVRIDEQGEPLSGAKGDRFI